MTTPQSIETQIASVSIDAEHIIHIRFKNNTAHGLAEAMEIVDAHNILADGVPRGVIADIRSVETGADRAARKYYVSEKSARYKLGMAMLVNSPTQRMLGNIFFLLNRPPYPSKMFLDEGEALNWLRNLPND